MKIMLMFLALILVTGSDSLAVEVGGNITENTIWTKQNNPYILTSTLQVLENITLTIEAGVIARLNENCSLNIGGNLIAIGKENEKIIFTSNSGGINNNSNIAFFDSAVNSITDSNGNYISGCILKYCEISNINNVLINWCSPFLSDNLFTNLYAVDVAYSNDNIYIKNNSFTGNRSHGLRLGTTSGHIYIEGNTFKNNMYGIVCGSDKRIDIINNSFEGNTGLGRRWTL